MNFDYRKIKSFWDDRADQYRVKKSFSGTNLEENVEHQQIKIRCEKEKISEFLNSKRFDSVLDLGSGLGFWSNYFANRCKRVVAVEFSEKMTENARIISEQNSVNNIKFITENVLDYVANEKFDLIFISGLMIYIGDEDITRLQSNIKKCSRKGSYLLLRDGTGTPSRYQIADKYSEALKTEYSALYRTSDEYKSIYKNIEFVSIRDEDMFKKGSPLNKHPETKLRLYLFKRL